MNQKPRITKHCRLFVSPFKSLVIIANRQKAQIIGLDFPTALQTFEYIKDEDFVSRRAKIEIKVCPIACQIKNPRKLKPEKLQKFYDDYYLKENN